jgi:MFS family permease
VCSFIFFSEKNTGRVLLAGACGTLFFCLAFGFAFNFWFAMVIRFLGGLLNGNIGVVKVRWIGDVCSDALKTKKKVVSGPNQHQTESGSAVWVHWSQLGSWNSCGSILRRSACASCSQMDKLRKKFLVALFFTMFFFPQCLRTQSLLSFRTCSQTW